MDTMAAAFATVRMAGRVPNATYRLGSARCPIAPAMDAALRASAVASAAGRDPTAINVSVKGGAGRLSLSDFARSLAPPLPLCAVLTWHKNAKIIYLPCLQFRAVFTPRRHVDTAPIRHTHTLSHTMRGVWAGLEWGPFAEEAFGACHGDAKIFQLLCRPSV